MNDIMPDTFWMNHELKTYAGTPLLEAFSSHVLPTTQIWDHLWSHVNNIVLHQNGLQKHTIYHLMMKIG